MPRKQLYVSTEDERSVWEPAAEMWNGSLSSLVTKLVREFVEKREEEREHD